MDATTVTEVTGELRALAAARHWDPVTDYLSALPDDADPGVLVLTAPGADAAAFRAGLSAAPLDDVLSDAGTALRYNRVVVLIRCGAVLSADSIAAAAVLLARPPGSRLIVVTGAETLTGDGALDRSDRAVWQALLGQDGEHWAGQDPSTRGCLYWAGAAPVDGPAADVLRRRLHRDDELIRGWFADGPRGGPDLVRLRLAYAVDRAADLAAQEKDGAGNPETARLEAAIEALRTGRERALRRLDRDAVALREEVTVSLYRLEERLLGIIRQGGGPDQVRAACAGWTAEANALVAARLAATTDGIGQVLDGVDWALVNAAVPGTDGRGYPQALFAAVETVADLSPGPPPAVTLRTGGERSPGVWVSTAGGIAVGAALAMASSFIVGPIGAGVVGASGGVLAERLIRARGRTGATPDTAAARNAVSAYISGAAAALGDRVDTVGHLRRRGANAGFERLATALREARDHSRSEPGPDAGVAARLSSLRARLFDDAA